MLTCFGCIIVSPSLCNCNELVPLLCSHIHPCRGVLETLIRRHFPVPVPEPGLSSIDWSLMDNDPTLPRSCRVKKQQRRVSRKTDRFLPMEEDLNFSDSEDSSSSPERSDSAVESSLDDGEKSSEGSGSSSSESEDEEDSNVNPFSCEFSGKYLEGKKTWGWN